MGQLCLIQSGLSSQNQAEIHIEKEEKWYFSFKEDEMNLGNKFSLLFHLKKEILIFFSS